jgi:NAD(P)-dependent dehydrogenase (short-subunit alcohol dehydrogenase family)
VRRAAVVVDDDQRRGIRALAIRDVDADVVARGNAPGESAAKLGVAGGRIEQANLPTTLSPMLETGTKRVQTGAGRQAMYKADLLAGQRILITGGGTGLGKSMGRRFLELGASLAICGRREAVLAETAAEFERDFPGRTMFHACDVRDAVALEAMIDALWREAPLDALVNNAAGNFIARSETLSPRAVDAVLGIVLHGSAYATLACGRRWIAEGRKGNVLSIVTSYAWTGSGYVLPSAMAKAGVLAMTRSLAVEWGPKGIRLNAIAPGPFPTQGAWERLVPRPDLAEVFERRNALGRVGDHLELANLAAFLLARESGYITGDCVTIDGGEWLKGAGQFSWLDRLTDEEWDALRPRKS